MRNRILLLGCFLACTAQAQTYVQPYVRNDGTVVQGHMRSAPDSSRTNNYSSQGNVNPYTGQAGTVNPYQPPQINPYAQPNIQQPPQYQRRSLPSLPGNPF